MKSSLLIILPITLVLASCGKPPPPQGPPSDFPVPSVVGKATIERLEEKLPLVGSIRARDTVRLQSEIEARVLRVGFEEGEFVAEGDVLFELDKRREEARLAEAVARLERAKKDFERGKVLLESKTIPPQEEDRLLEGVRAAEANVALAQAALEDAIVKAPFAGLIGERGASVGQFVGRGGALATVTSIDPVEVEFDVPERFVSQLALNQVVRLQTTSWGDKTFEGKIHFLAPEVNTTSRTLRVKAELANKDRELRPGMFGTVTLVFSVRDKALVIPEGAIMQMGDQAMVVAVGEDGTGNYRPVKVGARLAGRAEILEGLKEGEKVVVEGHQKVRPGATIIAMPGSQKYGVEPTPMPQ